MSAPTVLGLDIGGTWTRALVLDAAAGTRLGASRRAGANPTTHGVEAASAHIAAAVAEALENADLAANQIDACVVGMAGASKLAGDPAAAAAIAALWQRIGLRCPVRIVADVTTAFAAGSPEPDGSILLAGTGAIAAIMADRRPAKILGGHGWLLGDEGSGFWIGREAVRATLAALDEGVEPSGLTEAVLAEFVPDPALARAETDFGLGEGRRLAAATIAAANARPPVQLAALVPLVLTAADQGDRKADGILHEAAALLVDTLERARSANATRGAQDPTAPIVLAGGVLAPGSPVHRLVREAVTEAWPKATVTEGVDGAAAAAWLAALDLLDDGTDAAALHAELRRTG
ncbi:MAG TPA: BadF/BadG/BcrA/BcrD ATPase family protein [Actinospica sp.]|nr:BadF/BadG/BcrA/BcrD ATPase family protein [Actinospica sp.]